MIAKDPAYDAPTTESDFDRGFSLGYRKAAKEMTEQKEAIINATLDRVLEIIYRLDAEAVEDFEMDTDYGLAVVHERFAKARKKISNMKGGKDE